MATLFRRHRAPNVPARLILPKIRDWVIDPAEGIDVGLVAHAVLIPEPTVARTGDDDAFAHGNLEACNRLLNDDVVVAEEERLEATERPEVRQVEAKHVERVVMHVVIVPWLRMEDGRWLVILVLEAALRAELWPLPKRRDAVLFKSGSRLVDVHHVDRLLRRYRHECSFETIQQGRVVERLGLGVATLDVADEPNVDVGLWTVHEERADGHDDSCEAIGQDHDGRALASVAVHESTARRFGHPCVWRGHHKGLVCWRGLLGRGGCVRCRGGCVRCRGGCVRCRLTEALGGLGGEGAFDRGRVFPRGRLDHGLIKGWLIQLDWCSRLHLARAPLCTRLVTDAQRGRPITRFPFGHGASLAAARLRLVVVRATLHAIDIARIGNGLPRRRERSLR